MDFIKRMFPGKNKKNKNLWRRDSMGETTRSRRSPNKILQDEKIVELQNDFEKFSSNMNRNGHNQGHKITNIRSKSSQSNVRTDKNKPINYKSKPHYENRGRVNKGYFQEVESTPSNSYNSKLDQNKTNGYGSRTGASNLDYRNHNLVKNNSRIQEGSNQYIFKESTVMRSSNAHRFKSATPLRGRSNYYDNSSGVNNYMNLNSRPNWQRKDQHRNDINKNNQRNVSPLRKNPFKMTANLKNNRHPNNSNANSYISIPNEAMNNQKFVTNEHKMAFSNNTSNLDLYTSNIRTSKLNQDRNPHEKRNVNPLSMRVDTEVSQHINQTPDFQSVSNKYNERIENNDSVDQKQVKQSYSGQHRNSKPIPYIHEKNDSYHYRSGRSHSRKSKESKGSSKFGSQGRVKATTFINIPKVNTQYSKFKGKKKTNKNRRPPKRKHKSNIPRRKKTKNLEDSSLNSRTHRNVQDRRIEPQNRNNNFDNGQDPNDWDIRKSQEQMPVTMGKKKSNFNGYNTGEINQRNNELLEYQRTVENIIKNKDKFFQKNFKINNDHQLGLNDDIFSSSYKKGRNPMQPQERVTNQGQGFMRGNSTRNKSNRSRSRLEDMDLLRTPSTRTPLLEEAEKKIDPFSYNFDLTRQTSIRSKKSRDNNSRSSHMNSRGINVNNKFENYMQQEETKRDPIIDKQIRQLSQLQIDRAMKTSLARKSQKDLKEEILLRNRHLVEMAAQLKMISEGPSSLEYLQNQIIIKREKTSQYIKELESYKTRRAKLNNDNKTTRKVADQMKKLIGSMNLNERQERVNLIALIKDVDINCIRTSEENKKLESDIINRGKDSEFNKDLISEEVSKVKFDLDEAIDDNFEKGNKMLIYHLKMIYKKLSNRNLQ